MIDKECAWLYDRIQEYRWEDDGSLTIWVYTFHLDELLQKYRWMCDGTNHITLQWVGDCIAIEHFEEWIDDIYDTMIQLLPKVLDE